MRWNASSSYEQCFPMSLVIIFMLSRVWLFTLMRLLGWMMRMHRHWMRGELEENIIGVTDRLPHPRWTNHCDIWHQNCLVCRDICELFCLYLSLAGTPGNIQKEPSPDWIYRGPKVQTKCRKERVYTETTDELDLDWIQIGSESKLHLKRTRSGLNPDRVWIHTESKKDQIRNEFRLNLNPQ